MVLPFGQRHAPAPPAIAASRRRITLRGVREGARPWHATLARVRARARFRVLASSVDLAPYIRPARRFDDVFDQGVTNDELYTQAVRPLIATIFR